jgi:hypothetical protein
MIEAIECQDEPNRPVRRNWLAEALWFTGTLYPQGHPIPIAVEQTEIPMPIVVEASFVHRHGFDTQAIVNMLKTTRQRFLTINKELSK